MTYTYTLKGKMYQTCVLIVKILEGKKLENFHGAHRALSTICTKKLPHFLATLILIFGGKKEV